MNEHILNSTATVSIDSAIGSPLWSAGAASALPDSDANEQGDSSASYRQQLNSGQFFYPEAEKACRIIDKKKSSEGDIFDNNSLSGHYVNIGAQKTSVEKGIFMLHLHCCCFLRPSVLYFYVLLILPKNSPSSPGLQKC